MDNVVACRLSKDFDSRKLKKNLDSVDPSLWTPVIDKKGLSWCGIALRSYDGSPTSLQYYGTSYKDTPVLKDTPYYKKILDNFQCTLLRVRLLKMSSGFKIGTHTDLSENSESSELRLHVPILSNSSSKLVVNNRKVSMSTGELWYVDVSKPHSAYNYGDTDRVHLIIDCFSNTWTDSLFDECHQ